MFSALFDMIGQAGWKAYPISVVILHYIA